MLGRFDAAHASTEGGVLLLRELEQRTGWLTRFARCFVDHPRVRARDRGHAPAGKSTPQRLEHGRGTPSRYQRIDHDGEAIERQFVECFLDAHTQAPERIVLDLDATDDPFCTVISASFGFSCMTSHTKERIRPAAVVLAEVGPDLSGLKKYGLGRLPATRAMTGSRMPTVGAPLSISLARAVGV